MKKIIIFSSILLMFFFAFNFVFADSSYHGPPHCYDPKVALTGNAEEDTMNAVRGACKIINYNDIFSLDDSIKDKYFFYSIDSVNTSYVFNATLSKSVTYDPFSDRNLYIQKDLNSLNLCFGSSNEITDSSGLFDKNIYSEKYYDDTECLKNKNGGLFLQINNIPYFSHQMSKYGEPTIEVIPGSGPEGSGEVAVVPITSPVTKMIEYLTINEDSSGNLYKYKIKIETYLDDGSMNTEIFHYNYQNSASTTVVVGANSTSTGHIAVQPAQKSFWGSIWNAITTFFKKIF